MAKRKIMGLLLRESDQHDGFTTLDLIQGTSGICKALDHLAGEPTDSDMIHCLAIASKVLSRLLADRVET